MAMPQTKFVKFRKFILYSGLYGSSTALLKLVGFLLFLWLAKVLSIADYASFGLFYAMQAGLASFVIAGIMEAVIGLRKKSENREDLEQLFGSAITMFIVMAIAFMVLVPLLFHIFSPKHKEHLALLVLAIVSGVALGFANLQSQIVRLREDHISTMNFTFLIPFAGLIVGAMFFLFQSTVLSFFLGTTIGLVIGLLLLQRLGVGCYLMSNNIHDLHIIGRRLPPFLVIAALGWVSGYGNNYIIDLLMKSEDVAKFTFLLSLSASIQIVASSLNQVWSPHFFNTYHQSTADDADRGNRVAFRWLAVCMGAAGGVLIILYAPILEIVGGNLNHYKANGLELFIMIVAYVALVPWWQCYNYFLLHGESGQLVKINVLTSIIGLTIWCLLMIELGSIGVYLGFLFQMICRSAGIVSVAKRSWKITIPWEGIVAGSSLALGGLLISTL